jgi:lycopene beta-cyclase
MLDRHGDTPTRRSRVGREARQSATRWTSPTIRRELATPGLTPQVLLLREGVDSAHDASSTKPSVGPRRHELEPVEPCVPDEYVLVGGGLQNALITLALLERRPDARIALIEREPRLGGNHTWCFHETDVPPAARSLLEPLVVRRWAGHDVAFPSHQRRVSGGYAALTSERLHAVVSAAVEAAPNARRVVANVREVRSDGVSLDDGQQVRGALVVDARGPERAAPAPGGYQKFLGLELALSGGTAPEVPMLMDATVEQLDGYRFMYVLPWASDRVLVEDTYYSDSSVLDAATLRERVLDYAARAGLRVSSVLREERGVLPIPSRLAADGDVSHGPLLAGYAGGLFHPTTGYSLPVAVRLALHLAARPAGAAPGAEYARWLAAQRRQARFCLLLNRMLFSAFAPEQRLHVLERFYRLPESTIRRFYALETSASDRARILCGRPPRGFSLRRLLAERRPS